MCYGRKGRVGRWRLVALFVILNGSNKSGSSELFLDVGPNKLFLTTATATGSQARINSGDHQGNVESMKPNGTRRNDSTVWGNKTKKKCDSDSHTNSCVP